MEKKYAKYMRYGKRVVSSYTGEEYKIVADDGMREDADTVRCVAACNLYRYELLRTWSRNHVGVTEEQREEMKSYEVELRIADVAPDNVIRFITPQYDTLFEVKDLDNIVMNGKVRKVYYIDEAHFGIVDGGKFHIREFAELCRRDGITVRAV